jgi:hypothetical protein
MSLDLITDLRVSDGCDAVVVFVCMLSKRCVVEPTTKAMTAEQLATIMHRAVFRHFGVPDKIVSDRDHRFMSNFWQQFFSLLGTSLNISTDPQTYGQTERTNQTFEQILRCYTHPLHDEWARHLANVEFALNSAVSTTTTLSPFKATLGFQPTTPLRLTFPDDSPVTTLPEQVTLLQELHRFGQDCVS